MSYTLTFELIGDNLNNFLLEICVGITMNWIGM